MNEVKMLFVFSRSTSVKAFKKMLDANNMKSAFLFIDQRLFILKDPTYSKLSLQNT